MRSLISQFDYGGACKNERAVTNGTFNHGSKAHYMASWDPMKGCKDVAYKMSQTAQATYVRSSGSMDERKRAVATAVHAVCAASVHDRGVLHTNLKLCDKAERVILDEGVSVFGDLGRMCLGMLASERENVSRALFDIHPWPKEIIASE